ncbi:hypothetical protein J4230_03405 [Candidatus Woesearchaeota archaeon]|nr:hypothetical protein [Candidatus Woesearchaeota archaeon]HAB53884.1 hypothetical protein [Ignavibacteriales bacterium]
MNNLHIDDACNWVWMFFGGDKTLKIQISVDLNKEIFRYLVYTVEPQEDIIKVLEECSLSMIERIPKFSKYKLELKSFFSSMRNRRQLVSNYKSRGGWIRKKEISFCIPFLLEKSGKFYLKGIFYYQITEKR